MAEIMSDGTSAVTNFFADWPPIKPAMIPRIESPVKVLLCDGRIVLRGQYDIALGAPGKGCIIVDLKTGDERGEHPEEIRYYALLETLKNQVPPRRIASYYLDQSSFRLQSVDEDLLESAVRRTAEGIKAIAELWNRLRVERLTPGPHCRYCPARSECEPGATWLRNSRVSLV